VGKAACDDFNGVSPQLSVGRRAAGSSPASRFLFLCRRDVQREEDDIFGL